VRTMLELRPLLVTRFAHMVPGGLVVAVGLWSGFTDSASWAACAALVTVGAVLAFRACRLGVTVTDRDLVIHGLVLTRTIPRESIADVTDWPAVVWRSELPGPQHSRIVAFRSARRYNAERVALLRHTVVPPHDD
jgi:hypothetical protein